MHTHDLDPRTGQETEGPERRGGRNKELIVRGPNAPEYVQVMVVS